MEADHLALETYLIFAVQSNFHGKSSILLFGIKIAIAFPYHTFYIFQSISMVAANPKAARDITVWIVKAVEKASILFAQLQMDLSLFWRQATTSFNCIVECVSNQDA